MSGQEHVSPQKNRDSDADEPIDTPTPPTGSVQERNAEVDALLDEIDDVLEVNAESFVRGFVQKGGQ